MGRSLEERPTTVSSIYFHRRSNRHYEIANGRMSRYQIDSSGNRILPVDKFIDLAIGSGHHARTFATRTAQGRLLELPLSWYSKEQAWAMSPGYDRADHEDFRREITPACLFCHSNGAQPAAIDCSRCHGSTEPHLKRPGRGTILNPARLPADRRLQVCLQCHLQTASAGVADSVKQPGQSTWSFQPGMALSEYKMLFDRDDPPGEDRFEVNHAGYRLLQSACFRQSKGALQCTTCHDPHTAQVRANACTGCHAQAHAKEPERRASAACAGCHMPKRVPSDAIHTEVTDHRIARVPSFTNPKEEDHRPYQGKVIPFYLPAEPLFIAAAQPNASDSILRQMIARDPGNAAVRVTLAKRLLRGSQTEAAIALLQEALRIDPSMTEARCYWGVGLAMNGQTQAALRELRAAIAGHPDHSLSWINLGITLESAGSIAEAKAAYAEAIRLQPDSEEARLRWKRLVTQDQPQQ